FPASAVRVWCVFLLSLHDALPISRRPRCWVIRPTRYAARAEPRVNRPTGSPADPAVPSISSASRAPTVIPAAEMLGTAGSAGLRSEEHTSELQSRFEIVWRPLLEK